MSSKTFDCNSLRDNTAVFSRFQNRMRCCTHSTLAKDRTCPRDLKKVYGLAFFLSTRHRMDNVESLQCYLLIILHSWSVHGFVCASWHVPTLHGRTLVDIPVPQVTLQPDHACQLEYLSSPVSSKSVMKVFIICTKSLFATLKRRLVKRSQKIELILSHWPHYTYSCIRVSKAVE